MGRRHRDMQQERRRAAAAPPARRRPARSSRDALGPGLSRYLVDLIGILLIAVVLNVVLRELGMINSLLRIILALVAGRVIVSLVRRTLDSRT
jgi:predicted lipid-binding transport protein (Tim44 family)